MWQVLINCYKIEDYELIHSNLYSKIVSYVKKVKVLVAPCVQLFTTPWTRLGYTPCNPLGSSLHGILQAKILEWVAIPLSI